MAYQTPATPPIDHLTRKLLRRAVVGNEPLYHLLEQLAIDSLYVLRDDFDDDINPNRWVQAGQPATEDGEEPRTQGLGSPFTWDGLRAGGFIYGHPGGSGLKFMSKASHWRASHRPIIQVRLALSPVTNAKFEIGFADVRSEDIDEARACVLVKSTPTSYAPRQDYAVAVRDTAHNTSLDLVTDGTGVSTTLAISAGPEAISPATPFTVTVALNEQQEARLWVNGIAAATSRAGPLRDVPLSIWLQFQGSGGGGPIIELDYIHAQQERVAL